MKLRDYIFSKAVTLCFLGLGGVIIAVFMALAGVSPYMIAAAELFLLILAVGWVIVSFFLDSSRIKRLQQLVGSLNEKYLLGEIVPKSYNPLERQYYDIMQTISRDAIGIVEKERREREEYCDYVESWIHEIKTPLTACSLILSNGGDRGKLKAELKRADNLTENILYYARMRTADRDMSITKASAAKIIEQAVKEQMDVLISANISVETNGDFTLYTDAKAVSFIIKQLLINCAKYCRGCHIDIDAADGMITVYDNGIGIPDYDVSRITERGFTGTNGRRLGGNTGMGLYIVNELCKNLGITFKAESKQNEYTRITLSFNSLTKM